MFKTEKTKAFTIKAKDPVMFYSDDNQHFRLVKKWGSDFTIFRRIKGIVTKSLFNHFCFTYFTPLILVSAFLSFLFTPYLMFIPVLVIGIFFLYWVLSSGDLEIDEHFVGDKYPTSLKSFYM